MIDGNILSRPTRFGNVIRAVPSFGEYVDNLFFRNCLDLGKNYNAELLVSSRGDYIFHCFCGGTNIGIFTNG